MSGIMGVWNVEGEPVAEDLLVRMNERMAHRGPDGASYLRCGAAGFAFQQLQVTPESVREKQPLQSTKGNVVLWDGRLDNRDELFPELRAYGPVEADSPDVNLVLLAYEVFGSDFAAKLDGDFVVAVYDPSQRQLLLARDAMGARSLYFCHTGEYLLFASEIKALLAHPSVQTKLNESSLAEFLFSTWDHRDETSTLFSGISCVPSATVVLVTPRGVSIARHFDFATSAVLRLRDQREYVEAYRHTFAKAVRRRLRSAYPTAITVSGGLDSSSIYCMAHALTKTDQRGLSPLLPIGMVVEDDPGARAKANEWEFQRAVELHCAAEMIRVPVAAFEFAHNREAKIWHAEGPWVIQSEGLFRQASGRGARVLLSGMFGDNLLMSSQFLLDLVLEGRWITAWKAYRGFRKLPWVSWNDDQGPNAWRLNALLLRELPSFLIPEALRPFYRAVRYRWLHRAPRVPFYSNRFLEVAAAADAACRPVRCRPGRAHAKALYLSARSKNLHYRIELDAKAAAMFPMDLAYPFRDRELVQLVMSMPGEAVYPQGDSRGIHREAMKGILPESVRLRRDKGDFTRVARLGVLADADRLSGLSEGTAMQLGLLKNAAALAADLTPLVQALTAEDDTTKEPHTVAGNLLALEDFLRIFYTK